MFKKIESWVVEKGYSVSNPEPCQNRLIHEKSPYLLQHAHNPVDWYPWGEEAFEKARREDKPIFLSIGYSTCHWCHVMERESFNEQGMAKMINQYVVPVKVDREERPDIDTIYMTAVTAMTGQGGWPLNVFLTPERRPFFGGTYFPPQAKWGVAGLKDVLQTVHQNWQENRSQILESSAALTNILKESDVKAGPKGELPADVPRAAFQQFSQMYDARWGGFGRFQKFPTGHNLVFLLRYWKRTQEPKALEMVERTLGQMAAGGIFDHLGGGFHRYATDRAWQVPHFEKMLYDQAILVRVYLEAYQITKNTGWADVARQTLEYVLRDMTHPDGGFYSAEDADSYEAQAYLRKAGDPSFEAEKREGAFYVWTRQEIGGILDGEETKIFCYCYGIKPDGNVKSDPHGEFNGKNILSIEHALEEAARFFSKSPEDLKAIFQRAQVKLFQARQRRPKPHLDDKILTDWNGLMISSLALGARVLKAPQYARAAETAAQFVIRHLVNGAGRLTHRYRDGEAAVTGTLEDYAFFINGLLDLYEAVLEIKYFKLAFRLAEDMIKFFSDEASGGFYLTARDAEELFMRPKVMYDGAIPSGNSMAALALARLSRVTSGAVWEEKLETLFQSVSREVSLNPVGYSQMLVAFDFAVGPGCEIVLASGEDDEFRVKEIADIIYKHFIPNKVLLWHPASGVEKEVVESLAPFVKNQIPFNGQPTVYVCENHACLLPVTELSKLEAVLKDLVDSKKE